MSTKKYLIISSVIFFLNICFYAYYHEYLIINFKKPIITHYEQEASAKKKINLYWWKNGWKSDEIQLLLNQNVSHDAQLILGCWLEMALDERILKKKIALQSALATPDGYILYISFDHTPFNKESCTFEKWMLIESILKTVGVALPTIKQVVFLLNNQPLSDTHLDFSNPWPIKGFYLP